MKHFADRVVEAVETKHSCVVVGLDPRPEQLPAEFGLATADPEDFERIAEAVLAFNRRIIEAVAPVAVAAKPQAAFYERLGWAGTRCLAATIEAAKQAGMLVIADVKRSDIGSTAEAYATAYFETFGADAVTVNPYLGWDGVAPFARYCAEDRGAFVLVKTTNPSSGEIQDWPGGGRALWARVADLVREWGGGCRGARGYSSLGAVVGATYPDVAGHLRRALPGTWFLVPGYGAQGADAEACRVCFDAAGLGALVNSSRGIIHAYRAARWRQKFGEGRWIEAVRAAAEAMRRSLEAVRRG